VYASSGTARSAEDSAGRSLHLADPTIFFYKGMYYLYGTVEGRSGDGFLVYTSTNMKSWKIPDEVKDGYALKKGDVFGDKGFWAPQVFRYNDKFYMAYVANENIAVAESSSPLGPFTQINKVALAAPVKQIDPFIFIDNDGKKYLYHVRLINGNKLFVAEMTDDLSAIKPETLVECINATEQWENTTHSYPVAEGPSIIKHKNLYYFVYTANDFRNPDYAVGYAVSSSPLGPWKKYEGNPILSRKDVGRNGTGHGDFIKDRKGRVLYVFHTHNSETKVGPRKTAIIKAKFSKDRSAGIDKISMRHKSFYYPVALP
jgi:beta-xylosidase